ncbi:MAG: hypothetical protein Q8N59_03400 [bacterium]|nr:hypothetical protein [bacterium]
MAPGYDMEKIKYATDGPTFEKAVGLYENGKITQFETIMDGFSAIVLGTKSYHVFVSARHYDHGSCECYLGQNDTLCKHMVAVAIRAVTGGRLLTDEDKKLVNQPICNTHLGNLSKEELSTVKKMITVGLRYIKPYNGPSRIWFSYQNSLQEGCNRLSAIVSELPVSKQTAGLLVEMLLRLDKKLSVGGVDDSDGTVGRFIEEVVGVLKEYVKLDPACARVFHMLKNRETCFGWEEPLINFNNGQK